MELQGVVIMLLLTPGPKDVCPFANERIASGLTLKSAWIAYASYTIRLKCELADGRRPACRLTDRLISKYETETNKLGELILSMEIL